MSSSKIFTFTLTSMMPCVRHAGRGRALLGMQGQDGMQVQDGACRGRTTCRGRTPWSGRTTCRGRIEHVEVGHHAGQHRTCRGWTACRAGYHAGAGQHAGARRACRGRIEHVGIDYLQI